MSSATSIDAANEPFVYDPDRDEPLAAQEHSDTIDNLHYPLRSRLPGPRCYVARDLRVYRDLNDLRHYCAPDVLVALGVPDRVRRRYVIAQEGKAPDLVIEVLSEETMGEDLGPKRDWYQESGVREYVIVDPLGRFSKQPRLQLWRFGPDASEHIVAGNHDLLRSSLVPFGWVVSWRDGWVHVVDLEDGAEFPLFNELELHARLAMLERTKLEAARAAAEEQAQEAMEQAQTAEAHAEEARELAQAAEVRTQAAEVRTKAAEARAQAAAEQARTAEERAAAEAALRQQLEAELERLRRLTGKQG